MADPKSRFMALDALRGISACLVALFHLQAYSHIYDLNFLRHSFLFVDFFFVLSGFVITANYKTRLLCGFSVWRFMFLRFARLYPLHFATLVVFVGIELLRYQMSGAFGGADSEKFSGPHSIPAIFSNLLLVQGLHVHDTLTWNMPSWSISVEFFTYAIFAVALSCLGRRVYFFIALVALLAPIILLKYSGGIDAEYDFGLIRCAFGFFIGFVCFDLYAIANQRGVSMSAAIAAAAESGCVGLIALFVYFCSEGAVSLAAPVVFGVAVLTFSFESGPLSRIFTTTLFVSLGALSYSIYMTHVLIEIGLRYILRIIETTFHIELFRDGWIGAEKWQGDLAYVTTLSLVIAISILTYRMVEQPAQRWLRRLADATLGKDATRLSSGDAKRVEGHARS
jgi:peptidoglycan/LPS O-acetylase OafA/YrhL